MSVVTKLRPGSYQVQFLAALMMLLLTVTAAITVINAYFHRQVADEHARELAQQALKRAEAQLLGITRVAAEQNAVLQSLVAREPGRPDLVPLLAGMAPAFIARPALSFVGLGLEADGEYAMLERLGPAGVRLRHFAVRPDGGREIRDHRPDAAGRMILEQVGAWNGYDPRTRPFYTAARAAGRPVWTDSYIFYANEERPAALGATLAAPLTAPDGTFLGVADTDFDTRAVSEFMAEVQRDLPGQIFVIEERSDGAHRVVAHSDYVRNVAMTEADIGRDPLAREVVARLPGNFRALRQRPAAERLLTFSREGEDYVAGYTPLEGGLVPDWLVVVVLPRSATVGALVRIQQFSLLALGLAAAVGLLAAGYLSRRIARPLERLTAEVARRVEGADGAPVEETGPDEVVRLARQFNALSARERARRGDLAAAESAAHERAERLARTNDALRGAAQIVADFNFDEAECSRRLTRLCCEALDLTRVTLWQRVEGRDAGRVVAAFDAATGRTTEGQLLEGADHADYWQTLLRERRVVTMDAAADPRTQRLPAARRADAGRVALLDVGIRARERTVGCLSFQLVEPRRAWTAEDEILALAVAGLIALTFERTARQRAEDEALAQSERLDRLNRALGRAATSPQVRSGDPGPAIRALTEICGEGLRVARAGIWLFRTGPDRLELSDLYTAADGGHAAGAAIAAAGHERYFAALRADRFLAAEDARTDPRTAEFAAGYLVPNGIHAMLDAPIRSRGEFVGVVCLEETGGPRAWTQDEQIFAGAISDLVSLVLETAARRVVEEEMRALNTGLEQRVTERTAELAAANDKLRELDRLKTEFLATMSHELRTPLNAIIGFSGILKDGMAGPVSGEQGRQLEMINSSAKHLLNLINDLLDVSRIEAGRMRLEPMGFDPGEVLRDVEHTLSPMVAIKGLAFVVENQAPGVTIFNDRSRFFQIVINLANNAVKFTEQGGVRLRLLAQEEQERLVVEVADTGPGIRPEDMERLFEAFRQLDGSARRVYEGTGLGLYLCRKLATLLGGGVSARSEFGRGSVFTFWVPFRIKPRAPTQHPFPTP